MNDLSQRLAHEADQFTRRGGTELELSQVLERAGEIRRGRRIRATMLMAACVLAVAVPTGLVATHRDTTHEPSPAPAPAPKIDHTAIALDHLETGPKPRTGWVQGTVWHGPDGREFTWSGGRATAVATVGTSTLLALADGNGMRATLTPPASGDQAQTVTSWPMEGGFAVSADGSVAAFVKPDGTPVVVQAAGTRSFELPRVPRGSGFNAVGVAGPDCTLRSEHAGCQVWVARPGQNPESWLSTAAGTVAPVPPPLRIVTAVADSWIAGVTRTMNAGSCSAVSSLGHPETPAWTTCNHALRSFSPDGRHVLATAAYGDGAGDTELAVLDASTGKVRLDLTTARDAFITQMAWEDDGHLLVAVGEGRRHAVLRIGLDGSREYAVAPVTGDPYESPFVLPSH